MKLTWPNLDFEYIQRFGDDISKLTKKEGLGYSKVKDDINNFFRGLDFEAIYQKPKPIRHIHKSRLIKSRIPNSANSLGTRGGFRLVYLVNPNKMSIILCHIYPKRGKFHKESINDSETADILQEVENAVINNLLRKVDFLGMNKVVN